MISLARRFHFLSTLLLVETLHFRHIAPTAPDTLATYPHFEQDPFVLAEAPHVYFAGNTREFATSVLESAGGAATTRVVCVPSFADTGIAVLVHLGTLEVTPLQFGVSTAAESMDTGA